MSLRPYLRERRVLVSGTRRFVCSAPTVATVWLATGLFALELQIMKSAMVVDGIATFVGKDPAAFFVETFVQSGDHRVARVLGTCVELWGEPPGVFDDVVKEDLALARELIGCVLSLCDVERIARTIKIREEGEAAASGVASDAGVGAVLSAASRFGVSPHEVATWPVEVFCDVVEMRGTPAGGAAIDDRGARELKPGESIPGLQSFRAKPDPLGPDADA